MRTTGGGMKTVTLTFEDGSDLEIQQDELATITNEELKEWGISREKLNACFAKGIELMKAKTQRRVRAIVHHTGDEPDDWEVFIVDSPPPLKEHNGSTHKFTSIVTRSVRVRIVAKGPSVA
jgi:hypothetical protein